MRRLFVIVSVMDVLLAATLFSSFASFTTAVAHDITNFDSLMTGIMADANDFGLPPFTIDIIDPNDQSPPEDSPIDSKPLTDHQAYLIETSHPGGTMTLQGPALAISRLHPEFTARLARAIREARESGLPLAGIFSAYRPPAFGIGGFSDKFNSLHTYGLAVDMEGIGGPATPETKTWREIAAKHGVVCPYDIESRSEWNHCQPTRVKIIKPENPLRELVSADGPLSLEAMFEVGSALIEDIETMAASIVVELPVHAISSQENTILKPGKPQPAIAEAKDTPDLQAAKAAQASTRVAHRKFSRKNWGVVVAKIPPIMVEEKKPGRIQRRARSAAAGRPTKHHVSIMHVEVASS